MSSKYVLYTVSSLYVFISFSIFILLIVTTNLSKDPKYEDARRETRRLSQQMRKYMDSHLKLLTSQVTQTETESIKDILAFGSHLQTAILSAQDTLEDEFEKWRNLRSNDVSRFVQEQLNSLQVCLLAYEIMQTQHGDAYSRVKSLDDIYYFSGVNPERWIAIYDHEARNEDKFSFKAGDNIHNYGNHWDGYSKGKHLRSDNEGLFPSYKVTWFQ